MEVTSGRVWFLSGEVEGGEVEGSLRLWREAAADQLLQAAATLLVSA